MKNPSRYEHGDGEGNYRIVSSGGKIIGYYKSEQSALIAYERYVVEYPAEMDGSSLQVWCQNSRIIGQPWRWSAII